MVTIFGTTVSVARLIMLILVFASGFILLLAAFIMDGIRRLDEYKKRKRYRKRQLNNFCKGYMK